MLENSLKRSSFGEAFWDHFWFEIEKMSFQQTLKNTLTNIYMIIDPQASQTYGEIRRKTNNYVKKSMIGDFIVNHLFYCNKTIVFADLWYWKTIKIQKECALDLHLEMICKILSKSHNYIAQTEPESKQMLEKIWQQISAEKKCWKKRQSGIIGPQCWSPTYI